MERPNLLRQMGGANICIGANIYPNDPNTPTRWTVELLLCSSVYVFYVNQCKLKILEISISGHKEASRYIPDTELSWGTNCGCASSLAPRLEVLCNLNLDALRPQLLKKTSQLIINS